MVALTSCEEFFVPDISEQESVLVVEGFITNEAKRHMVKISRSNAYNSTDYFERVSGYTVRIQEKGGDYFMLSENAAGHYLTAPDVKGEVNKEYRVLITDKSGNNYASSYERLLPAAEINEINGDYFIKKWMEEVEGVGYKEKTSDGIRIKVSSDANNNTPFYRYEYKTLFLTSQNYPTTPFRTICYIARPSGSFNKGIVAVANANQNQNQQIIDFPIDFISDDEASVHVTLDSMVFDSMGNELYKREDIYLLKHGFYINVKQYSLSDEAYNFWNSIEKQLNTTGEIFDPVEAQIEGNINNIDDPEELVFGFFGASQVTQKPKYFYLKYNNTIETLEVDDFPELKNTKAQFIPFDFWVNVK